MLFRTGSYCSYFTVHRPWALSGEVWHFLRAAVAVRAVYTSGILHKVYQSYLSILPLDCNELKLWIVLLEYSFRVGVHHFPVQEIRPVLKPYFISKSKVIFYN